MPIIRAAFWVMLLIPGAFPETAAADEGDAIMTAVLEKCPGAAKFILRGHPDLASLEKSESQAKEVAQASSPSLAYPALRDELLEMSRKDQAARFGDMSAPEAWNRLAAVDAANLARLKQIVLEKGFPDPTMVGRDGFNAAWLLVQHADPDPAFQQDMLGLLMEKHLIEGEQLALLTDRVLRAQGKPQRYGSQFTEEDGRQVPQPIEEPVEQLDKRRATMGMMPFADYQCAMDVTYLARKNVVQKKP